MGGKSQTKSAYFDKLKGLLEEFKSIFIVTVDNVSSQQMHEIRASLRGEGVVLMGKNTMVCNFLAIGSTLGKLTNVPILHRFAVLSRVSLPTTQNTSVLCRTLGVRFAI